MQQKLLALALAGICLAAPSAQAPGSGPEPPLTQITANYDDEQASTTFNSPVGRGNNGVYDGLKYSNFFVFSSRNPQGTVDGVVPQSQNNVAAAPPAGGDRNITTAYQGSPYAAFNLEQFFFGCVINDGMSFGTASSPCTVTVTGFRANNQVASQSFDFTVQPTPANARQVQAELNNNFNGITSASFAVTSAQAPPGLVILVDNLNYVLI